MVLDAVRSCPKCGWPMIEDFNWLKDRRYYQCVNCACGYVEYYNIPDIWIREENKTEEKRDE